ncbi:transglycosylase domain-containing protein [Peribacillus sp. SCS-37]|uniref:transglycosylase domain-containing protein n=1 Tax=Paraperibacillus esterisolvens TaxID=3115296 RepID=UPI0039060465
MRKTLGFLIITALLPAFAALLAMGVKEAGRAESVKTLIDRKIEGRGTLMPQTSFIKSGDGRTISEITLSQNRISLDSQKIPHFLKQIFIAVEDRQFYEHFGVDISGIGRAVIANAQSDASVQGGSTITQQLARNLYLSHERTYNRKLAELLYSLSLERKLTKDQILEAYINTIYFQNGAYGIEAASRLYFNKGTHKLNRAELAFLAAIPNNPLLYDPLVHFSSTKKRQERILGMLKDRKLISVQEYKALAAAPISLHVRQKIDSYPDYTAYTLMEFKELVSKAEGYAGKISGPDDSARAAYSKKLDQRVNSLLESGITIHTALDRDIQSAAGAAVMKHLPQKDIEGASVVIEHHTHKLVSLIGGKYYKKYSFNRAYQAYRQPGSAIKPLLVYGPYIEGRQPVLTELVNAGSLCLNGYCPHNADNTGHGLVTITSAFSQSYNTAAVRMFAETGIQRSFAYLSPFSFKKVVKEDYRLPAAAGGFTFGMSPLELTSAYTSFYDGTYQPARAIDKVTDSSGKILYSWKEKPRRVWSRETAMKMRTLLRSAVITGTAKKARIPGPFIGGKTGTTNDYKDLWFIGLTDKYTAGVWVGRDIPASIQEAGRAAPHLLIWKDTVAPGGK